MTYEQGQHQRRDDNDSHEIIMQPNGIIVSTDGGLYEEAKQDDDEGVVQHGNNNNEFDNHAIKEQMDILSDIVDDNNDAKIHLDGIDKMTDVDDSNTEESGDGDNDGNRFGDISYRPRAIILYSPPIQRQKWNDKQTLPRINWGDLFFDLFYVAATYNVSYIIYDSPSRFGFLYSIGTYWPLQGIVLHRTTYDARFVIEADDIYHRFMEIIHMCVLSVAVLAIRPICYMAYPSQNMSMFLFALAITIERWMTAMRYIEVYFYGIGQHMIKTVGKREFLFACIPLPFYIAATIIAGIDYFHNNNQYEKDSNAGIYSNYDTNSSYDYNKTSYNNSSNSSYGYESTNYTTNGTTTATTEDESHRFLLSPFRNLAGDSTSSYDTSSTSTIESPNHIPIYLCLFGYISSLLLYGITIIFFFPSDGSHKERTIPLNVGFIIHRNSEWIMINLGESVFSLLIVDIPNEDNNFYTAFYCSVLTVTLLAVLHFKSQPIHDDHHAMRRNKNAGYIHFMLNHVYTYSLVSLGAAFSFILLEVNKEQYDTYDAASSYDDIDKYNDTNTTTPSHRWLNEDTLTTNYMIDYHNHNHNHNRWLADSKNNDCDVLRLSDEKYAHNVAMLFCITLATIYACLDLMTLCHLGFKHSSDKCFCPRAKKYNVRGIILVSIRIFLIFFTATMSEWEENVKILSILGLILTIVQLLLRQIGSFVFGNKQHDQHHHG